MASTTSSFGRFVNRVKSASRENQRVVSQTRSRPYSAAPDGSISPEKQRYVPTTGTYPLAFKAASTHVGVKESNTRFNDLALIASDIPCSAAAVFTKNKFQAAPVTYDWDLLTTRGAHGIRASVINSGCANAVTGRGGLQECTFQGGRFANVKYETIASQYPRFSLKSRWLSRVSTDLMTTGLLLRERSALPTLSPSSAAGPSRCLLFPKQPSP